MLISDCGLTKDSTIGQERTGAGVRRVGECRDGFEIFPMRATAFEQCGAMRPTSRESRSLRASAGLCPPVLLTEIRNRQWEQCKMGRMSRGKILGVDYGSKNVGIACSDELRLTVEPLPSVPNRSRAYLLSRLRFLVQEMGICEIVIGLPVNMDGSSGEAAARVGKFMEALEAEVSVPVHGIDERLSTIEALEVWNTLTPRRQRRYGTVDSLAAAFILERFLKET